MKLLLLVISTFSLFSCLGQSKSDAIDQSEITKKNLDTKGFKGIQFEVSNVKLAANLLKTDSSKYIFENKLNYKILYLPEEHRKSLFVNCHNNGLIQTIQECYDNHRPLILTPDIIWLAICQGVSIHINEKYDSLKNIIFTKDKPDKLTVKNDSLEYNSKHWKNFIDSLSHKTKKYTNKDYYNLFVSNFSTTGPIEKTAYQITLIEAYKKGFEYVGESGCGIPSITLKGKKEDWIQIKKKLEQLNSIGLSNWANNLDPVIDEFIHASDGTINKEFWQSIYKTASEYDAFYISGWIIKFFPYKKIIEFDGTYNEEKGGSRAKELYTLNEFMDGSKYLESTLSTDNFPTGISKVDIKWNNFFNDKTRSMLVFSGFFAMKQYPDKSLEPLISWAVCDKNIKSRNHILKVNKDIVSKHNDEFWSPHICKNPQNNAVYDIKTFQTNKASDAFVKLLLEDSLRNSKNFKPNELSKIQLEFTVYSNGTIGNILIKNNKNILLLNTIKSLLISLPEKWMPALAYPEDVLMLNDPAEKKIKVKVNSKVKLNLFIHP